MNNELTCYVCHKPTFVSIPEEQGSGVFVPACQKCYQTYSSEGALHTFELKSKVGQLQEELEDLGDKYLHLKTALEQLHDLEIHDHKQFVRTVRVIVKQALFGEIDDNSIKS